MRGSFSGEKEESSVAVKQDFAIVDFETRSRTNLESSGAYRYVENKETIALCLAWKLPGDKARVWKPGDEFPYPLLNYLDEGGKLCAWNANFDRLVWNYVLRRQIGDDHRFIPIDKWVCAMVMSAEYAGPRKLGEAAKELGVEHQKMESGKRLVDLCCKPSSEGLFVNAPWTLGALYEYCRVDVETTADVIERLPELHSHEQELYEVDQHINDRGILIDVELARAGRDRVRSLQERVYAESIKLMGIRPTQRERFMEWMHKRGCYLDDTKASTLQAELKREDLDPDIRKALQIKLAASKTSNSKFEKLCEVPNTDGRARGCLVFYGAGNTGRFSGYLIQPQNFPKGVPKTRYNEYRRMIIEGEHLGKNSLAKMSSMLRGVIIAPPGKRLFCVDFKQIEARLLMMMANDRTGVDTFVQGRDIYIEMAADIFGKRPEDVTDDERFIGKSAVLGLGYMMGVLGFIEYCHKEGALREATAAMIASHCSHGVDGRGCEDYYNAKSSPNYDPRKHSDAMIHASSHIIRSYRERYSNVPKLWDSLVSQVTACMNNRNGQHGRFWYNHETKKLSFKLHSGRRLYWHNARQSGKNILVDRRDKKGMLTKRLWAGLLTENIIQATARDVLGMAMVVLERVSPFDPIATIHDEIVAEGDENTDVGTFEHTVMTSMAAPFDKMMVLDCSKYERYFKS